MPWPSKHKKTIINTNAPIDDIGRTPPSEHDKYLGLDETWSPENVPPDHGPVFVYPGTNHGGRFLRNAAQRKAAADQFSVETDLSEVTPDEYDRITNIDAPVTNNKISRNQKYKCFTFTDGEIYTVTTSFKVAAQNMAEAHAFAMFADRGRVMRLQTRRHIERVGSASVEFSFYAYNMHRKAALGDDFTPGLHALYMRVWVQQLPDDDVSGLKSIVQFTGQAAKRLD